MKITAGLFIGSFILPVVKRTLIDMSLDGPVSRKIGLSEAGGGDGVLSSLGLSSRVGTYWKPKLLFTTAFQGSEGRG